MRRRTLLMSAAAAAVGAPAIARAQVRFCHRGIRDVVGTMRLQGYVNNMLRRSRDQLALDAADAGEVALWEGARLETTLKFIHLAQRKEDPEIRALLDVLHHVWTPPAAMRETA